MNPEVRPDFAGIEPVLSDGGDALEGLELWCETCARDWELSTTAANPVVPPPSKSVIYFIRKDEVESVREHNKRLQEQALAQHEETSRLGRDLQAVLRLLRSELVSRAESAGAGIGAKFEAVGKALGFSDLGAFRSGVGRRRPATYVEALVTVRSCSDVLRRLAR